MASEAWDLSALAKLKPAVRLTIPSAWHFRFPPSSVPQTLPPPSGHPTLAHPFTIPHDLYNNALDGKVPITIALVYITVITFLNSVNKSRGYKPWAFSKTSFFKALVILHNIFLAVYSAWTFVGMVNALRIAVYNPRDTFGFAGTVDSVCKLNGPRGVGSAARYNEESSTWKIGNRFFHLGADGLTPDSTDVGRLWNEGLAFYGWLFYLSKYYEVIDSLIIIAKGKKSSFLQTYHHAGAMICMWAGIRYMSPPIWIFVLFNSFIHAIMYTFYLCSAIGVKVPVWVKRTLTTMQITQFVAGASSAFLHFFVKYQAPVSTPYTFHLGDVATAVMSDASPVASTVTATASANVAAYLKKALLRAAGREGLAENVLNNRGQTFGVDAIKAAQNFVSREEIRYRDDLEWTHCLDTSGQAFAIYVNVLYLLPLTWLFGRFFVKSYLKRLERRRSSTASQRAHMAVQSVRDASQSALRRASHALEETQGGAEDTDTEFAIIDDEEFKEQVEVVGAKAREVATKAADKAKAELNHAADKAKPAVDRVKKETQNAASKTKDAANQAAKKANAEITSAADSASKTVNNAKGEVKEAASEKREGMSRTLGTLKPDADSLRAQAGNAAQVIQEKAEGVYESVRTAISSATHKAGKQVNGTDKVSAESGKVVDDVKSHAQSVTDAVKGSKPASGDSKEPDGDESKPDDTATEETKDDSTAPQEAVPDTSGEEKQEKSSDKAGKTDKQAGPEEGTSRGTDGQDEADTGEEAAEEASSSKEKVRDANSDEKPNTETGTGDAKAAEASTNDQHAEDVEPKGSTASRKSKEDDVAVKDSSIKDKPREEETSKGAVEEPETKGPHTEDRNAAEANLPGRQDHFHEEREQAIQKLKSAGDKDTDVAKPQEDDGEAAAKASGSDSVEPDQTETSQEETPSFDEARAEALEKLASAKPETNQDDQPSQDPESAPADKGKEPDDTQKAESFEDQKESWIHVDDNNNGEQKSPEPSDNAKVSSEKGSFADVVKKTNGGEDQADSEDKRGFDDNTDKSGQGAETSKETAEDVKEKEEQDRIIDESEPVRDDVKDTATATENGDETKELKVTEDGA